MPPTPTTSEPLFLYPRLVFDAAFLGWARRPRDNELIAVYSFDRCIDACMKWYDMTTEGAYDYVINQIESCWRGPGTPLLMYAGEAVDLEDVL